MKKILITGGTGFIGQALCRHFSNQGADITVLSRTPEKVASVCGAKVKALDSLDHIDKQQNFNIIINLAGAGIFDARWTDARKQILRDSRIRLTAQLVNVIAERETKPELLISGSAIGYYGNQGNIVLHEDSGSITDFSSQLCADWEAEAMKAEAFGVRVCLIRTGLVLAEGGGLIARMLWPFKCGFGGRIGSGKQWMSWIHRQDWIRIIEMMISNATMRGAYNATAPNPVTNLEFTQTLAKTLQRPALFPLPESLLKLLLGEMSELLLGSQQVLPQRLLEQGFEFQYPELQIALSQILRGK